VEVEVCSKGGGDMVHVSGDGERRARSDYEKSCSVS